MTRKFIRSFVLKAGVALQIAVLCPGAFAAGAAGGVGGVTRDSLTGMPVPDAQIVAHNVDRNTTRAVSSGIRGFFAIDNLEPGRYEVIASKEGFKTYTADVEIAAMRTARLDLVMNAAPVVNEAAPSAEGLAPAVAKELEAMKARIDQLEAELKQSRQNPASVAAGQTSASNQAASGDQNTPKASTPRDPNQTQGGSPTAPQSSGLLPTAPTTAAAAPVDNVTPFADYDWTWLNGNPAEQRCRLRFEVLYSGNPGRPYIRLRFQ